jgi:1,4-alpha-glucan branching enzyme
LNARFTSNRLGPVKKALAVFSTLFAFGLGCSHLASRGRVGGPLVVEDGVQFRFYAPSATRVQLAGDWPGNNWARGDGSAGEADIGLMDVDGKGNWQIVVPLAPGRYRYLFWVDENTWHLDPGNPEEVAGGPVGVASQVFVFLRDGKREIR